MRALIHGSLITLLLFFCASVFATTHIPSIDEFGEWTVVKEEAISPADTTPTEEPITSAPTTEGGFLQRQVTDGGDGVYIQTVISTPPTFNEGFVVMSSGEPLVPLSPTISGTISDYATQDTVSGISISIYDSNNNLVETVLSDAQGFYTSSNLSPGGYYVKIEPTDNYLSIIFSGTNYYSKNLSCMTSCELSTGSTISVGENIPRVAINFALEKGGLISGVITDADSGEPLQDIYLNVYDSSGDWIGRGISDAAGQYLSEFYGNRSVLPSGNYYVETYNSIGYVNERFNNNDCFSCDITSSTPIVVSHDNITTNINFSLEKGGRVSGTVTDAENGDPLKNIRIHLLSDRNNSKYTNDSFTTDSNGRYISSIGLTTGTYYLYTSYTPGYAPQLYNSQSCTYYCDVYNKGTPVAVTAPETRTDINFTLTKIGQISGTITDADNGEPLKSIAVKIYDAAGLYIETAYTDSSGYYVTIEALKTGLYYMHTSNTSGYLDEVNDGQLCIRENKNNCDGTSGTVINVTEGEVATGHDFSLSQGGRIAGAITETATGQATNHVTINIYNELGVLIHTTYVDTSGQYISGTGLPTGIYYVSTSNINGYVDDDRKGYIDEIYNERTVVGPDRIIDSTAISVTSPVTTKDIDFSLEKGSRISGSIINPPKHDLIIYFFDLEGDFIISAHINPDGSYQSEPYLPTGDYHVLLFDPDNLLDSKLYGNVIFNGNCEPWKRCDVTMGTPVSVIQGSDTININFTFPEEADDTADNENNAEADILESEKEVSNESNSINTKENSTSEATNADETGGAAVLSAPLLMLLALALLMISAKRYQRQSRFFISV